MGAKLILNSALGGCPDKPSIVMHACDALGARQNVSHCTECQTRISDYGFGKLLLTAKRAPPLSFGAVQNYN